MCLFFLLIIQLHEVNDLNAQITSSGVGEGLAPPACSVNFGFGCSSPTAKPVVTSVIILFLTIQVCFLFTCNIFLSFKVYLNTKEYPKVEDNLETEVLVIGGGIAGLLTAKKLKDNNIKVILVEKDRIGRGTTINTTAFLTVQHETLYQDLPFEKAKEYLRINNEALKEYEQLSQKYNFDFIKTKSCLFSEDKEKIKKEYLLLNELDQDVTLLKAIPIQFFSKGISSNKVTS